MADMEQNRLSDYVSAAKEGCRVPGINPRGGAQGKLPPFRAGDL
jgi:hypothetical protein